MIRYGKCHKPRKVGECDLEDKKTVETREQKQKGKGTKRYVAVSRG